MVRTALGWPAGQVAVSPAACIGRSRSNVVAQVRQ
jgi:hypothetical protein